MLPALSHSLKGRLLIASLVGLPLLLLFIAVSLSNLNLRNQEQAVKEQLQLQSYLLLGALNTQGKEVEFNSNNIYEPRFEQLGSGIYAVVYSNTHPLWRSPSSRLLNPLQKQLLDPRTAAGNAFSHDPNAGLYRFQLNTQLPNHPENQILLIVLSVDDPVMLAQKDYMKQLFWWLLLLLLLVLLSQWLIMRWGLKPLEGIASDLQAIKAGDRQQLNGDYPVEICAVTNNLNLLLLSEREQRERYRHRMADLAHSLKTPLAVIRGANGELGLIDEQVERMDQIVQYQLSRAIKQPTPILGAEGIALKRPVERIASALAKVYSEKGVQLKLEHGLELKVAADERELMEILGNLLENAFKYGKKQVKISATSTGHWVLLEIEDDGNGVPANFRQQVLQRGARLDSAESGQGIGLAVVVELLSQYGGELTFDKSPLGGAKVNLALPAGR